jgi:uncharacterized protein YbjT (DUF2867 family)
MKFVITGSLGNISKTLAETLISSGHDVTLVSSDPAKVDAIRKLGAHPAIGSIADVAFLTDTFKGADAIYTMVPPNWEVANYREYIAQTGKNYRDAIIAAGIKRVVNLSSVGAHLSRGTGPIAGLYDVEQTLNTLNDVAVKHLRAGIFYINYFFNIGMIKTIGIMGNNYGAEAKLVMVHPRDIAAIAAQELQSVFTNKSYRYVAGETIDVAHAVKVLGASIDKPDLSWVKFSDEETFAGMVAAGMSEAIARLYVEMGKAIDTGILFEDFNLRQPEVWGTTKLTDFAYEFAVAYKVQN